MIKALKGGITEFRSSAFSPPKGGHTPGSLREG
nr:MAG TPA: hypothetical protein [Caudoviricetes sp.]DAZ77262.1 MAG TPA: hypothetical protein [Caudoviricetes sp.]